MRTTLELPEDVLSSNVVQISGKKKKSEAVRIALEDYIQRNALKRLFELRGNIEIEDVSEELERAELAGTGTSQGAKK